PRAAFPRAPCSSIPVHHHTTPRVIDTPTPPSTPRPRASRRGRRSPPCRPRTAGSQPALSAPPEARILPRLFPLHHLAALAFARPEEFPCVPNPLPPRYAA